MTYSIDWRCVYRSLVPVGSSWTSIDLDNFYSALSAVKNVSLRFVYSRAKLRSIPIRIRLLESHCQLCLFAGHSLSYGPTLSSAARLSARNEDVVQKNQLDDGQCENTILFATPTLTMIEHSIVFTFLSKRLIALDRYVGRYHCIVAQRKNCLFQQGTLSTFTTRSIMTSSKSLHQEEV